MAASDSKRFKCNEDADRVLDKQERSLSHGIISIENELSQELCTLEWPENVTHTYNPLEYATEPHSNFVQKFGASTKSVLFLGMNPGPFGMAQNGIPFGDTVMVKEWLKVEGKVGKPLKEHPKRTVHGLECSRREVTGTRFWSLWSSVCGTAERFFDTCYVHNYCPLCFMTSSGKNVTPPTMKVQIRRDVERICDASLLKLVELLKVRVIVGVGKYAEECANRAISGSPLEGAVRICSMPHPSPANPKTSKNWQGWAMEELKKHGVLKMIQTDPFEQ